MAQEYADVVFSFLRNNSCFRHVSFFGNVILFSFVICVSIYILSLKLFVLFQLDRKYNDYLLELVLDTKSFVRQFQISPLPKL